MKKDIHPEYREVLFADASADFQFITRSTIEAKETRTVDGKEYPFVQVDISSESHPFFTGKMKFVDTAGRVEKFQSKFAKTMKQQKKDKEAAAIAAKEEKERKAREREEEKARKAEEKAKKEAKLAKEKEAAEKKAAKEQEKLEKAKAAKAEKDAAKEKTEAPTEAVSQPENDESKAETSPVAIAAEESTESSETPAE